MKDVILHLPSWLTTATHNAVPKPPAKVTVFYFITGNPGLIGYYEEFLDFVTKGRKGRECIVAGASLGGFEIQSNTPTTATTIEARLCEELICPEGFKGKDIYDLQNQINLSYTRLAKLIETLTKQFEVVKDVPFQVLLAGHSVGAYIALELVRLQHEASVLMSAPVEPQFSIAATFLLTPTIHNISESSSGRIATPVLGYLPFLPSILQLGTSGLTTILPMPWLRGIVMRATGMKSAKAVDTTAGFLRTPGAVKQALYMAGCEMREIGEDRWTEEVWGVVDAAKPGEGAGIETSWKSPKHYFLFAKEDHWVADVTRNAIVNSMWGKATVLVDVDKELGLVHAWCLQQNNVVAGIVNEWIDEILGNES
ncbi:hypothetical protein H2198_010065 [Neophaeococcomyces mojaviensis]|uniref:Uncharacterized protein n=1 Tax=Neophaeococcomyces mojaviensis TaxID=3383035 RepID=A0ACC2ZSY5_9EURO|nr:hypothetical protein H2198_010065 [Knufia sp. JES_112]